MSREQRDRMAETFVAVGDALRMTAVPTYGVVMGSIPKAKRPAYLPEVPPQTARQYEATLGRLGRLGLVKRNN